MIVLPQPMNLGAGPSPDYVTATNLDAFVAHCLWVCWLGCDPDDLNANCYFTRPLTPGDVTDLRGQYLDLLETVIVALWKADLAPGHGDVEANCSNSLVIDEPGGGGSNATFIQLYARLDDDALMLELSVTGADSTAYFLSYRALHDRQEVVRVVTVARQHAADQTVWDRLLQAAAA